MTAKTDLRLLRLAEAISDRETVAWDDAWSEAGELRPVVEGLHHLSALAEAFAGIQAPSDREETAGPTTRWGQLEILEPIGEGAFGEVFRARDPNLDREVALKLRKAGPSAEDSAGRRLLDEARRLARIRHPNVMAVYGADLCDGRVGIWTELIEGSNLEQRLVTDGPFGAGEAIAIGLDLCRALASIHAAGLVHGDVKAANVLRERGGRIVLSDLGSATEAGSMPITGSPATLAPEVLAGGSATPSADLYSLGVLLFQLLSGRLPVDTADSDVLDANRTTARRTTLRDLRPDLPPALVNVVEKAVDPDPERRYSSVGALERALAISGDLTSRADHDAQDVGRLKRTMFAVAAVAAALTTVAVVTVWQTRSSAETESFEGAQPAVVTSVPNPDAKGIQTTAVPEHAAVTDDIPAAVAVKPLDIRAVMLRQGEEGAEELSEGDLVRPGDRLSLEIEATEPVHVWVVNEDLDGNVFVLFPIEGLDLGNPLESNRSNRLPGRLDGVPQHWQVTSAGGRERFLVIASRCGLPEIERELAGLSAATSQSGGTNRGVGGLEPVSLQAAGGRLDALVENLTADRKRSGSVWIKRLELINP